MQKEQFTRIAHKYMDTVYRVALNSMKSPDAADDITQEVFLRLLRTETLFASEEHTRNWLIRVTINKCKNFKRSFWQRNRESIEDFSYLAAPEKREMMEELYSLPENYRNIIYLYYYEEYTIPEIAEILEKNENTVKSSLQRARKRLKKILTEEGEDI